MDRLPEKIDSKFRYVLLASQRAEQMMRGAAPRIDITNRQIKPTRIAMEEITQNCVEWEYGPREVEVSEPLEEDGAVEEEEAETV